MENAESKFVYTSLDVCNRFAISAPRLLQFRKGRIVKLSRNENGKSVEFTHRLPPILTENVDFIGNGNGAMFSQSAMAKIENIWKNR